MLLQLETLSQLVAAAPASLLMLDYDGTLAPFTTRRDHAFPYPGVRELLQQVTLASHTRVVIISGRDVSAISDLLDLNPGPEIWGLHGIQRRVHHVAGGLRAKFLQQAQVAGQSLP